MTFSQTGLSGLGGLGVKPGGGFGDLPLPKAGGGVGDLPIAKAGMPNGFDQ